MVVQARTREFYGPYGFTGRVVKQGVVAETAHVREGGSGGSREVLSISFKEMGPGLRPYPFALAYAPLDFTARILKLSDQEPFVIVLRISECEWIRAEASAHFFETDGENFSTTAGATLAHMGRFGDHALFDDFPGKAILAVEFECARLHHHGARFLARSAGFRNETALHIPAG